MSDTPPDKYSSMTHDQLAELLRQQKPNLKRHYRSSYTQANANLFIEGFESYIATGNPVVFKYVDYPRQMPRTLYNKVCDALLYLVEESSPEDKKKWRTLRESVTIKMLPDDAENPMSGIVLMSRDKAKPMRGHGATIVSDNMDWRNDLTVWLEQGDGTFHRAGLKLTADEVEGLRQQMDECGFTHNINTQVITVMK